MTKNNNKILFVGICAAAVIIIAIIFAIVAMQRTGLSESFFVSDGTKYVITLDSDEISVDEGSIRPAKKHLVYFYNGDSITGMKEYYLYNQAAEAEKTYQQLKEDTPAGYQAIAIDGKYLVLTVSDSIYEGKTATEIRQYIEFLNSTENDSGSDDNYEEFDENGDTIESDDDSELDD
ncbi:hypothetical protein IKG60_00330 [Candidatus Saccharibacteria bacterium]|nr:hypothetical protein [Candidatus Saccharibacteria bacterium]